MKKKDEPIFLGTIHIQVGPKGFFPWIWDLVTGIIQGLLMIFGFWIFVILTVLIAAKYLMPYLPTYDPKAEQVEPVSSHDN